MRVVVKHVADPEETISAVPGKVTVEVEPAEGMAILGAEPIELALGQQANVEVGPIGYSSSLMAQVSVQAVID